MNDPFLPRDLLDKYFGDDPRMVAAFETQDEAVQAAASSVEATGAMKDATVIVLSANGDFTNERVLEVGEGIAIEITASAVKLSVDHVALTRDHKATLIPPAAVVLFLPPEGTLVSAESPAILENKTLAAPRLADIPDFANDAAAAAGGVEIGQIYRNASQLLVRVA